MDKKTKEKIDYEHEKKLELLAVEFENKIEILEKQKGIERLKHELALEILRIKSAEIRKTQQRQRGCLR